MDKMANFMYILLYFFKTMPQIILTHTSVLEPILEKIKKSLLWNCSLEMGEKLENSKLKQTKTHPILILSKITVDEYYDNIKSVSKLSYKKEP